MTEQFSFLSVRWPRAKSPKRAEVLRILDELAPWDKFEAIYRPYYQADIRKTGRKGYSLKMMLRCYVFGMCWQLTDHGVEAAILDSLATARFVGTDPWQPRPPSASAIRNFRNLIDRSSTTNEIQLGLACAFANAGIDFRPGAIQEPIFRQLPKR